MNKYVVCDLEYKNIALVPTIFSCSILNSPFITRSNLLSIEEANRAWEMIKDKGYFKVMLASEAANKLGMWLWNEADIINYSVEEAIDLAQSGLLNPKALKAYLSADAEKTVLNTINTLISDCNEEKLKNTSAFELIDKISYLPDSVVKQCYTTEELITLLKSYGAMELCDLLK